MFVVEDVGARAWPGAPGSTARSPARRATHDAAHTDPDTAGDPAPVRPGDAAGAGPGRGSPPTRWTWCSPTRSACPARPQRGRGAAGRVRRPAAAVTAQKPLTGRAHQGGSALDVATALLALAHDTLPASAGPGRAGRRLRAGLPAVRTAGRAAGWRWSARGASTVSTARWSCAGPRR